MGQLVYQNIKLPQMNKLASLLAKKLSPGDILVLKGPLGAGKTTFTKETCHYLKIQEEVTSPSFTLINKYNGPSTIYHLDFYRLSDHFEVNNLDLEEIFSSGKNIIFIEWADNFLSLIPQEHLLINFKITDHLNRTISFKASGKRYKKLLKELGDSAPFRGAPTKRGAVPFI